MSKLKQIWEKCLRTPKLEHDTIMETELKRCLTTFDLVMFGISGTVGGGIYVVAGTLANEVTGPALFLSFIVAAFAHFLTALCFAEFGCQVPKAGSIYLFVYLTMGELSAFIVGWIFILSTIFEAAVACRGVIDYINRIADNAIDKISPDAFVENGWETYSWVVVSLLVIAACLGIKQSARVNTTFSIINIATIFFVIVCGIILADLDNWSDFLPFGFSSIFKGAAQAYFAFTGYDLITISSEEAMDPSKSVPAALLSTIAFIAIAYSTLTAVITLMVPYTAISKDAALVSIFKYHDWKWAEYVATAGVICALLGVLMGSVLCISRSFYAMAFDGLIFESLGKVNKTTQVPIISTIFGSVCVILVSTFCSISQITEMLAFGHLLVNTLVSVALIVIRYSDKSLTYKTEEITSVKTAEIEKNENDPLIENVAGWDQKRCFLFAGFIALSICSVGFLTALDITHKYGYFIAFISLASVAFIVLAYFGLSAKSSTKSSGSFQVPFVPLIPGFSVFINFCIMSQLDWSTWVFSSSWAIVGLFVYFIYGIKHSKLESEQLESERNNWKP